jgi:hypothetical protein
MDYQPGRSREQITIAFLWISDPTVKPRRPLSENERPPSDFGRSSLICFSTLAGAGFVGYASPD